MGGSFLSLIFSWGLVEDGGCGRKLRRYIGWAEGSRRIRFRYVCDGCGKKYLTKYGK